MKKVDTWSILERMENEIVGMKGRRKAKKATEDLIEEMTGQKHSFSANRESFHHFNVVVDPETSGSDSLFVSYDSKGKVKNVSKI